MSDDLPAQTTFLEDPPPRRGEYLVPEHARVEQCRSCGMSIIWARTRSDHAIPLSLATIIWRGAQRYALAHFADCPDSKEWSKRHD